MLPNLFRVLQRQCVYCLDIFYIFTLPLSEKLLNDINSTGMCIGSMCIVLNCTIPLKFSKNFVSQLPKGTLIS